MEQLNAMNKLKGVDGRATITQNNMTIGNTLKTAVKALRTNRSRSFLTILGIVIGITAIILISSLGKGAQDLILSQVQGLGSKTIVVRPGKEPKGPSDAAQLFNDSLKVRDLEAIKKTGNVPTLSRVVPVVIGAGSASFGTETYNLSIFGVSDELQSIFSLDVSTGVFLTPEDIQAKASVAVLGSKAAEELFGDEEPVGQKIKIKNQTFKVVGVIAKKGASLINFDNVALVPYTTAQQYVLGQKHFTEFIVEAESEDLIDQTVQDITYTLRELHNISDPEQDDFYIETQAEVAESLGTITSVLTMFLASVAGISLFVAGIGIMNIMLVSVTERTREIGLRKALGATEKNILTQFLFESVALTGVGGIIGIILGTSLSLLISMILSSSLGLDWAFTFPFKAALMGIAVSAAVGLVFGLYPARKASQKSPIEALRYE
jgi:putative ABC transport system permease protein